MSKHPPLWKQLLGAAAGSVVALVLYQIYAVAAPPLQALLARATPAAVVAVAPVEAPPVAPTEAKPPSASDGIIPEAAPAPDPVPPVTPTPAAKPVEQVALVMPAAVIDKIRAPHPAAPVHAAAPSSSPSVSHVTHRSAHALPSSGAKEQLMILLSGFLTTLFFLRRKSPAFAFMRTLRPATSIMEQERNRSV